MSDVCMRVIDDKFGTRQPAGTVAVDTVRGCASVALVDARSVDMFPATGRVLVYEDDGSVWAFTLPTLVSAALPEYGDTATVSVVVERVE